MNCDAAYKFAALPAFWVFRVVVIAFLQGLYLKEYPGTVMSRLTSVKDLFGRGPLFVFGLVLFIAVAFGAVSWRAKAGEIPETLERTKKLAPEKSGAPVAGRRGSRRRGWPERGPTGKTFLDPAQRWGDRYQRS